MSMNGGYQIARPGSAVPYSGNVPRGAVTPYAGPATARPMTVVDRFRQNGSTGRDDTPLRKYRQLRRIRFPKLMCQGPRRQ